MSRWKSGKLHSGTGKKGVDGPIVKSQKQAVAIALSVCGKSDHAERLMNLGFSEEAAFQAAELLFKMPDWNNQFKTGETLSQIPREEITTIAPSLPGMDVDNRPGKQKGSQGKQKRQSSQAIFPITIPKGNPQQGPRSRSDLTGLAAFEETPQDPLTGQCNQKEKREKRQAERTPEQQQADKEKAAEMTGKPVAPNADRQEAARKAAETRKKCKTGTSDAKPQSQTTLASGAGRGATSNAGSGAGGGASSSSSSGGAGSGAGGGAGSGAR
jgi:hypothetical protein